MLTLGGKALLGVWGPGLPALTTEGKKQHKVGGQLPAPDREEPPGRPANQHPLSAGLLAASRGPAESAGGHRSPLFLYPVEPPGWHRGNTCPTAPDLLPSPSPSCRRRVPGQPGSPNAVTSALEPQRGRPCPGRNVRSPTDAETQSRGARARLHFSQSRPVGRGTGDT